MNCDFNEIIDRRQTGCVKWDFNQRIFGREDILPLWVADMDFKAGLRRIKAAVKELGEATMS